MRPYEENATVMLVLMRREAWCLDTHFARAEPPIKTNSRVSMWLPISLGFAKLPLSSIDWALNGGTYCVADPSNRADRAG